MSGGADADLPAPADDLGGARTAPPRERAHRAAALLARALGRPAAPARYDGTELTPRRLVRALSRRSRELALQRLGRLACFRADDYAQTYADVRRAGMDPRFHALFVGGFEERRLFRPETLAKCLGAPLQAPPPAAMPPPGPLRVGVYVSSLGNIFMREIAEDVAAGLRVAGATADVLDETSPIGGRPPCCVFVAPHEFFHLDAGAAWVREDVVANALMLNTEQPQTRWFGRALPFLLASRGVIELCPQAAALFAGADMPSLLVAPAPNLVPLAEDVRRHPLFRVLPAGARAPASASTPFAERAIDVAFFGTESGHREDWFSRHAGALADFDCVIHYRREDRGPLRAGSADAALTRLAQHVGGHAKIVLNLHRDAFGYLEWHRIVRQGLLPGAVVVSEPCLPHPLLLPGEHYFEAPARQIPPLIGWLVRSEDGRQAAARMQANVRALLADVVTPAATGAKIAAFLRANATR